MINGCMKEAKQGSAVLTDVDEDTVARFIQWAYSGNYSAAGFSIVAESESSRESHEKQIPVAGPALTLSEAESSQGEVGILQEFAEGDGLEATSRSGGSHLKRGKKKAYWRPRRTAKDDLKEAFASRKPAVRRQVISIPPARQNQAPNEDCSELLLSHARLYIFAEKYDIKPLKELAFENLQSTLAIFTLYDERTGDIIGLLRYIYACMKTVPGMEDLRALMTDYVGYEMDTLMKDQNFIGLMIEDGGTLLEDFTTMVQKRL